MTAAIQDDLFTVLLPTIAADSSIPNRVASRVAILTAISMAADAHRGLVHISWVRPYLPASTNPQMIGAVISGLHLTGHLLATGRYLPNGGVAAGNASKPAKVSRLTRPIPGDLDTRKP